MSKTDNQLKSDIEAELLFDPTVNAAQIGVTVDHGIVSLLGAVDTYAGKWAAENATKRVAGVRTVALDLTVKPIGEHLRTDSEVAAATQAALRWDVSVPATITATVQKGEVTLEGRATWNYQRVSAERAVGNLSGVTSIRNFITLAPEVATIGEVKAKVEAALQRQATSDAKSIHVEAAGGKVTLSGSGISLQAMKNARSAAWTVGGVNEVVDTMSI